MHSPATQRICKGLAVEATADADGLSSTIYCRIAIPLDGPGDIFELLTLNTSTTLLYHSIYALPLPLELKSSVTDAVSAARIMGIHPFEVPPDTTTNGTGRVSPSTPGGVSRRRSTLFAKGDEGELDQIKHTLTLGREGEVLNVVLHRSEQGLGARTTSPTFVSQMRTPTSAARLRAKSMMAEGESLMAGGRTNAEFIVVLRMETKLGKVLRLPRFANTIALPLPLCLHRNHLSLTLPPHPSTAPQGPSLTDEDWELTVRPTLTPTSPSSSTINRSSTTISGTFPCTPTLALRWTPSSVAHKVILPNSELEIKWKIMEKGNAEVVLEGKVQLDWTGVKERVAVDFCLLGDERTKFARGLEGVGMEITGETIKSWEILDRRSNSGPTNKVAASQPTTFSPPPSRTGFDNQPQDQYDRPSTPTPRRRPPTLNSSAPRPPSFTSLFDTPPPVPPQLDSELLETMKTPSLLTQSAPFVEGVDQEISFELSRREESFELDTEEEDGGEEVRLFGREGADEERTWTTTIRLLLDLKKVIGCGNGQEEPSFDFRLVAYIPPSFLRRSSPLATESTSTRFLLPSFSFPTAQKETNLITVSGGPGSCVEVLNLQHADTLSETPYQDSPLPSIGGVARWKTERGPIGANDAAMSGRVEGIEVELKKTSPTPLIPISNVPRVRSRTASSSFSRPSIRTIDFRTPTSTNSTPSPLQSKLDPTSPTLIVSVPIPKSVSPTKKNFVLSLVEVEITPVAPAARGLDWKVYYQVKFPRSSVRQLELPVGEVKIVGAWDRNGNYVEVEKVEKEETVVLKWEEGKDLELLLWMVGREETAEKDTITVGNGRLVMVDATIAMLRVELLEPKGYDLAIGSHEFDSVLEGTTSTSFRRFQIPPRTWISSPTTLRISPKTLVSPPPELKQSDIPPSVRLSDRTLLLQLCIIALLVLGIGMQVRVMKSTNERLLRLEGYQTFKFDDPSSSSSNSLRFYRPESNAPPLTTTVTALYHHDGLIATPTTVTTQERDHFHSPAPAPPPISTNERPPLLSESETPHDDSFVDKNSPLTVEVNLQPSWPLPAGLNPLSLNLQLGLRFSSLWTFFKSLFSHSH